MKNNTRTTAQLAHDLEIDQEIYEAGIRLAKAEGLTFEDFVIQCIEKHLQRPLHPRNVEMGEK